MASEIRVVVVDDSQLMQQMLAGMIAEQPDMTVVGTATDPFDARDVIKRTNPHVITLDIEMPRMDGLTFLEKIMKLRPTPVVMVSSLTRQGAAATVRALELGACDVVAKPLDGEGAAFERMARELIGKIREAASAHVQQASRPARAEPVSGWEGPDDCLIALGASTGGVERLRAILTALPAGGPPIVFCQHMAPGFVASFAERLDQQSAYRVRMAEDGMIAGPGDAVLAAPTGHLEVARQLPAGYRLSINQAPPEGGHRPAVDRLFSSVASIAGKRSVGVILSGMGADGAAGLLDIRQAGGHTIGESEASCVVYGMPRAAKAKDAVVEQLAVARIPQAILRAVAALPRRVKR